MGWIKDLVNPSGAENDRYREYLAEKRKIFPKKSFNLETWKNASNFTKISICENLSAKTEELRILKYDSANNVGFSDGFRVDSRLRRVYTELLYEYEEVLRKQVCGKIISATIANEDRIRLMKEVDDAQRRIGDDTDEQRKIILAVGGGVLLLGSFLILKA